MNIAPRAPARRRGPRPLILAFTISALLVGTAACSAEEPVAVESAKVDQETPTSGPDDTTGDTTDPASPDTKTDLLDGTRAVDLQTYGGQRVTTTVEGGVRTVTDPAEAGGVPTTWVVQPLDGGGFQLRSTATTDGQSPCLSSPGDNVLTIAPCNPAAAAQRLDVVTLDQPDQVNISSAAGFIVATPTNELSLAPDPTSPASVFTLIDRGPADN